MLLSHDATGFVVSIGRPIVNAKFCMPDHSALGDECLECLTKGRVFRHLSARLGPRDMCAYLLALYYRQADGQAPMRIFYAINADFSEAAHGRCSPLVCVEAPVVRRQPTWS